jgi:ribose transport system substrate-binding protein
MMAPTFGMRTHLYIGLAFPMLITGCNQHHTPTIAFLPQATAEGVWEPAHLSSSDRAKQLGYRLYWNAPSSPNDVQGQVALLRQVMGRRYEGLILAPNHLLASMTLVLENVRRGIPTVIVGSPLRLPPQKDLSYVLNDEEIEGRLAAERIGQQLHGVGTVAILGATPNIQSTMDRLSSFERILHSSYPGISIVSRELAQYNETQAAQVAQEILRQHPDVNAIFALTSSATAGALYGIHGRVQRPPVLLVGCGQQFRLLYYLSQGEIDSIIAENTHDMGTTAVQILDMQRSGKLVPAVTYIAPVLITKDNLYSPEFAKLLTRDHRMGP